MSTHPIDHRAVPDVLAALTERGLPEPQVGEPDEQGLATLTFTPDLTQAQADRLTAYARAALVRFMSPDTAYALRDQFTRLRAYRSRIGGPSNAQVVQAVDDIIDVLAGLLLP